MGADWLGKRALQIVRGSRLASQGHERGGSRSAVMLWCGARGRFVGQPALTGWGLVTPNWGLR